MVKMRVIKNKVFLCTLIFLMITFLVSAANFITNSQSDFNEGTYNKTFYNASGFVQLNETYNNGTYTSKVFDAGSIASWPTISWESSAYGNLPNAQAETFFANHNINMSGNILLMHFDQDTNYNETLSYVYDYSGNGNNAVCGGTSCAQCASKSCPIYNSSAGKINGAYLFQAGYNRQFNVSGTFDPPHQGTISAWIYPTAIEGGSVTNHVRLLGFSDVYEVKITGQMGNLSKYRVTNDLFAAGTGALVGNTYFDLNEWHHLVWTYDYNTGNAKIYVDGVLDANGATADDDPGSGTLTIGTRNGYGPVGGEGFYDHFDGYMDELSIWNRVLSASEIDSLYRMGLNKINFSVRSCDDASCSGENWTDITDRTPQSTLSTNNRYFQYKSEFDTDNINYTPELYNVTVNNNFTFVPPITTESDGSESTNLTSYDLNTIKTITNFTFHKNGKGKIKWKEALDLSNGNIGRDNNLDDDIEINNNFVAVNSVAAPVFAEKDATLTFENVSCNLCAADNIVYSTGEYSTLAEIQANGQSCSAVGKCSNFICNNPGEIGNCTFDVTGFTGYAFGGNANLTINDSAEGSSVNTNTAINFFAYYVNATSGNHISGASCNVSFDDAPSIWYQMTDSGSYYNYTKSAGFSTAATHVWNVSCAKSGFTTLVADDTVSVTSAGGAVPEFSDYAILLILITVVSGFFIVRKRNN
ncbi:MAG: LamG domain-containing protein [Nanoarchaeota archaeon]|nr:LamG domain-containing protein [Nanoarchaeota archaeon]